MSLSENKPTEKDLERFEGMLQRVFTCQICGQPKTHHRLHGYRCHNPEHAELERERQFRQDSERYTRAMRSGKHSKPRGIE